MIIELESYKQNQRTTYRDWNHRLHGHICYWDRGQRVSVTMVAVHMGVKEAWLQTGHRGT